MNNKAKIFFITVHPEYSGTEPKDLPESTNCLLKEIAGELLAIGRSIRLRPKNAASAQDDEALMECFRVYMLGFKVMAPMWGPKSFSGYVSLSPENPCRE